MAAFDLVTDKASNTPDPKLTQALCITARENGLILLSCGFQANAIRFLMPVTIEPEVLAEGLDIIERTLSDLVAGGERATG